MSASGVARLNSVDTKSAVRFAMLAIATVASFAVGVITAMKIFHKEELEDNTCSVESLVLMAQIHVWMNLTVRRSSFYLFSN